MKFAGKAWKLLVGVKDALVLIVMLAFFGGLYAALSASPYRDSARSGALRLDLAGAIVEQPSSPDPLTALGGGAAVREYRLAAVIRALDEAAANDRIEAVALDLDIFTGGGQSAIANVGEALDRVRGAGKRVVAYATGYGDDGYQLAAHADEIWLDPLGAVVIAGPGSSNLYYAGLMERLGITANVYRVGTFKSAVEPYTRNDMSPEAREANQALADLLWETWRQDVGRARPRAQVAAYVADPARFIAAAGGDMARAARDAGMVDRIGDRVAFGRRMAELAGEGEANVPGSYRAVHYEAWADEHPPSDDNGQIGILTVAGEIIDGEGAPGTAGGETIAGNLERGLEDGRLKAPERLRLRDVCSGHRFGRCRRRRPSAGFGSAAGRHHPGASRPAGRGRARRRQAVAHLRQLTVQPADDAGRRLPGASGHAADCWQGRRRRVRCRGRPGRHGSRTR